MPRLFAGWIIFAAFGACACGQPGDEVAQAGAAAVVSGGEASDVTMASLRDAWEQYERTHASWPEGSPEADAFVAAAMDWLVGRDSASDLRVRVTYFKLPAEQKAAPIARVVYARAESKRSPGGEADGMRILAEAVKDLRESGAAPLRCSLAAAQLGELQEERQQEEQAIASYKLSLEQYLLACSEAELGALEQRYLAKKLSGPALRAVGPEWGEAFMERFLDDDRIDPWLKEMTAGRWHVQSGWRVRGGGFADTVAREGWIGFAEHFTKARERYMRAYELHPERPEAATEMIEIAMAGHSLPGESQDVWFERATAAQFDWVPAYEKLAWALRPRWNGSIEEMVRFGLRCAATKRYDTPVPRHLIYMLLEVCEDMEDFEAVWRQRGIYPAVRTVLDETIEQDPEGALVPSLRTEWAVAAWRAQRYDEARTQLELVGRKLDEERLADFNVMPAELLSDVYAHTCAEAHLVRQAERAGERGDWGRAAEILNEVILARRAARARHREEGGAVIDKAVLAGFARDYETGEWTNLPLDYYGMTRAEMAGWRGSSGHWSKDMQGAFEGRETNETMLCVLGAPVGRRFEFEAIVDTTGAPASWAAGGLAFGFTDRKQEPFFWSVRVSRRRDGGVAMGRRLFNTCDPVQVETTGKDKVRVICWDDWACAEVNGEEVFNGELPFRRGDPAGDRIGVCSGIVPEGTVIRFSDLRVRKLESPPPQLTDFLSPAEPDGMKDEQDEPDSVQAP